MTKHYPWRQLIGVALTMVTIGLLAGSQQTVSGDVRLPAIFGDHMVLQQSQKNPVWGWADAGEKVTVTIADQSHSSEADSSGRWKVAIDSLSAGGPHTMTVKGSNTVTYNDVLIGEVWLCSGQSNMQWPVTNANDPDLEIRTADYPQIRLITVPQIGTQQPQDSFDGKWELCSPETVAQFSAVGYFFGRQLHESLNVPIGLIDNAWGGSACEAWISREVLEADAQYQPLLKHWSELEKKHGGQQANAAYEKRLKKWEADGRKGQRPRKPRNPLAGQHRPANLYNGVLKPIIGYGIRGAIWYQGESNSKRAYQYRHLFPSMIQLWRDEWGQGDFPFYWVQLADFREESTEPSESDWAELREAQTMTMSQLANTGEAVIVDLGEAHDIHPKDKQNVAKRLARWALARDYQMDIAYRSPAYQSVQTAGKQVTLTFDHIGGGLDTFDVRSPVGFAIAGEDKKFVWASAKIVGNNKIVVWSDKVADPVAVRYGWADNPVCNVQSREGLPLTPFRTDDWPGVTSGVDKP